MIQSNLADQIGVSWFQGSPVVSPVPAKSIKNRAILMPMAVNEVTLQKIAKVAEVVGEGELIHFKKEDLVKGSQSFFLRTQGKVVTVFVSTAKESIAEAGSTKPRAVVGMHFCNTPNGLIFKDAFQAVKLTANLMDDKISGVLCPNKVKKATDRIRYSKLLENARNVVKYELTGLFGGKNNATKLAVFTVRYTGDLQQFCCLSKIPTDRIAEHNTVFFLREIGRALKELHSRNILHCDLSPSNCLLNYLGNLKMTKVDLSDFDLSKQMPLEPKQKSILSGTYEMLAPELTSLWFNQAIPDSGNFYFEKLKNLDPLASVGPWNDIYSFGICAYAVLKGEYPELTYINLKFYDVKTAESLRPLIEKWKAQVFIPAPSEGPLLDYIYKLLDPNPDRRPTAQEVVADIEPMARSLGIPD